MATREYVIDVADGWVLVDDTGNDFALQSRDGQPIQVTFGTAPIAEDQAYHFISGRQLFNKIGTDNCHVKAFNDGTVVTVTD